MNLIEAKKMYTALLLLRRDALVATLDAREYEESQTTDTHVSEDAPRVAGAGALFTVLDQAVQDMRAVLITDLRLDPEFLYN